MRQLGLAAIVLVVAGGLLSGFSEAVETAAVKIGVPARYVQATPSAHGSIAGGQFRTQRLQVQLTESAAGSATGVARTAATYASGYVVFNHSCPSVNPTCPGAPTKPGYEVCYINPPAEPCATSCRRPSLASAGSECRFEPEVRARRST